jgi:DNA-directed RNA polymerase specialized sigma24 family protein
MDEHRENEWSESVRGGNEQRELFARVFLRKQLALIKYVRTRVRDDVLRYHAPEDIVLSAFGTGQRAIGEQRVRADDEESMEAFIWGVLRHKLLDRIASSVRDASRERSVPDLDPDDTERLVSALARYDDDVHRDGRDLAARIARLDDPIVRRILVLVDEMSQEEIGRLVGLSRDQVKRAILRAMRVIRLSYERCPSGTKAACSARVEIEALRCVACQESWSEGMAQEARRLRRSAP